MAWNEPGGSNNNDDDKNKKDPWGKPNNNNGGPPDLDEVLNKLKNTLAGLFGENKPSGSNNNGQSGNHGSFPVLPIFLAVAAIIVGFWLTKAIYVVDQQEEAIVLRLGKFHDRVGPGLHIYFPPIDKKYQLNVAAERSYTKHGQMLTQDENIVEIPLTVQYRISDPEKFILKNDDPGKALENATDSALRQVAGSTTMDQIIASGRTEMAVNIQTTLEHMLDKYDTGIQVIQVNIQSAAAPNDVQKAFDDVMNAREDKQRSKNQAEAYRNSIVPVAEGDSERLIKEAEAYRDAVIERAMGDAAYFDKLLVAYQHNPKITRERMYLETIQHMLTKTSKILISTPEGNNQVLYLPIDKLMNQGAMQNAPVQTIPTNTTNNNYKSGGNR